MTANINYQLNLETYEENKEPLRFAPETELEKLLSFLDEPIPQMVAQTGEQRAYYDSMSEKQRRTNGMDKMPIEIFNTLIVYLVKTKRYRDAMYLILQANYGMRFSDVVRLRFCHICNADGTIKAAFSLPNGELKTGKQNIYYNNAATKYIIKLFLSQNPKCSMYDFLFVSNSNNSGEWLTLEQTEAKEIYGNDIERMQKIVDSKKKSEEDKQRAADKIAELKELMAAYQSLSAEKDRLIQQPISHETANSIILKEGLKKIGIKALNCGKGDLPNTDMKFGTHSFRKTFADFFYMRGFELKAKGVTELQCLDNTLLKLLQDKYMHSDSAITRCYSDIEERAFKAICSRLDLGFDAICEAEGII